MDASTPLEREFKSGKRAFDLELKILNVRPEGDGGLNRLKVDYEIVNRSPVDYDHPRRSYYAYFTVLTKDGRELGHQELITDRIPTGKTHIEKETIELSVYEHDTISVELYIK